MQEDISTNNNKYFRFKEENPSLLEETECGPD